MNNKQKLVETIERISKQSGLSEGFLSNLFATKLKADPNVAKAVKKVHDSAKDLEDTISALQAKYPNMDIPDHILKLVGKK